MRQMLTELFGLCFFLDCETLYNLSNIYFLQEFCLYTSFYFLVCIFISKALSHGFIFNVIRFQYVRKLGWQLMIYAPVVV